jgi:hypothetical protein
MTDTAAAPEPAPAPGPAGGSPAGAPGPATFGADLPAKAADAVDLLVDTVHDRLVRPLMVVTRAVVFGLVAGVLLLMVLVLASVGFVRLLDVYAFGGRVWVSDTVIGGLFALGGGYLWTKRRPRPGTAT